jgi:hypothetical protein
MRAGRPAMLAPQTALISASVLPNALSERRQESNYCAPQLAVFFLSFLCWCTRSKSVNYPWASSSTAPLLTTPPFRTSSFVNRRRPAWRSVRGDLRGYFMLHHVDAGDGVGSGVHPQVLGDLWIERPSASVLPLPPPGLAPARRRIPTSTGARPPLAPRASPGLASAPHP